MKLDLPYFIKGGSDDSVSSLALFGNRVTLALAHAYKATH